MPVLIARDVADALAALRADARAELLAGGTDLMVDVNFGRKRVENAIAVDRIEELRHLEVAERVRVGATVTYTTLLREGARSAALAEASRTVGSPQIRNAGTIGGNIATSSPAGDTLPVLAALDATIVLRSPDGERRVTFAEFMTGPKRNVRRHDEIVIAAEWDDAGASQTFLKVGTRNAMVIAVASLALVVDRARRRVAVALGSCGPTILRAADAERFAAGLLDESGWEKPLRVTDAARAEFGAMVASAARPIDDVRGTAAYRRHVLGIIGGRALTRVAATL
ncbi:MAG TPA: FAD binding domain-containing protein [Candidatus Limnocylindrales bacterium]|nr:FAD binding domain-containing protein [Candidatus Limnocylindrales bacterium]